MEWDRVDNRAEVSLYQHLNRTLRQPDRSELRPWFDYLKLFLTALAKLPPTPVGVSWRGVHEDQSGAYPKGAKFPWWRFSSCTTSLDILESDIYMGKVGKRTLFSIESFDGRRVSNYSDYPTEDDILLLPGTYFEVISQLNPAQDLWIIHLKQQMPP
ncbi:unnamed protein product [Rotaria magnacalcarata]|uniref:NAD(P)(+)--arginine ADP-ribosyltransferase n=3 Tax=Rotaria magnacalcarata TaxID=392030 RepID=A0A816F6Z4_9BILA|nr:unnamed protein product [Rotaria magnacalcarata]CAF1658721.1 unnamed protein product [Rotaria magnacalcarata]CAF4590327.1 unnamed protein product [Rotaria magnacalcarata]CAF5057374.1 unnamed protein product [Rotaria magnacalcarata]